MTAKPKTKISLPNVMAESTKTEIQTARQLFSNEGIRAIETQEDYDYVYEQLSKLVKAKKSVDADRVVLTKPFDDEKKRIKSEHDEFINWAAGLETKGKVLMAAFIEAREKKIREDQAEADRKARVEKERLEKKAREAEEKGEEERAEHLQTEAENKVAVQVAPTKTAAKAQSKGTSKAKFIAVLNGTDNEKIAIMEAAMTNPILLDCITLDQVKLDKVAEMVKDRYPTMYKGAKYDTKRSVIIR